MTDNNNEMKNSSKVYALFYSFFLIPFMLAIFGAMFFFMFQFLTYEKNTPIDLLNNIQSGSATKRWQAAFELSNMLTADKINDTLLFENRLRNLFEKSKHDDLRVRTYIALAMGKTQNSAFGQDLIAALDDDSESVRIAAIKSLGVLKYNQSCSKLVDMIKNSDSHAEQLAIIISLGSIGNNDYSDILIDMLDNEEPNIRWDAAISLLKMDNPKGVPIVENLLKREFYKQFPPKKDGSGLDIKEIDLTLFTVISIAGLYIDEKFKDELLFLAKNDNNVGIRDFALKTIDKYYK